MYHRRIGQTAVRRWLRQHTSEVLLALVTNCCDFVLSGYELLSATLDFRNICLSYTNITHSDVFLWCGGLRTFPFTYSLIEY